MNLKDLPTESACPPDVLQRARTWLRQSKPNFLGTANFCVFSKTGYRDYTNQGCHQKISNPDISDRECVATEIGHTRGKKTDALVEPYLRYLLYSSYASPYILNKDDFEECRDYGVVVSADMPPALLQNVMLMTRHFFECDKDAFETFNRFLEEGINEDVAFHCCFNTSISLRKLPNYDPKTSVLSGTMGHRTQSLPKTLDDFRRIVAREIGKGFEGKSATSYRHYASYRGGVSLFSDVNYDNSFQNYGETPVIHELLKIEWIREKVATFRKEKNRSAAYRPPDPFARRPPATPPAAGQVTVEEFIEVLVPCIQLLLFPKGLDSAD